MKTFEEIRQIDENGNEFWYARELMESLEYAKWEHFKKVIAKAIESCKNSDVEPENHFPEVGKMVDIGSNTKRETTDYKLTRYACYLIAQNGNPKKKEIANAQTYFAIQTRRQEIADAERLQYEEDKKRLGIREQTVEHKKSLNEAAQNAGVKTPLDFAVFTNKGYEGLYDGLTAKDLKTRKGLKENQQPLDYMGSEELAANLFRDTQADAKLRRENIQGKENANQLHYDVGKVVRNTIKDLGGTMPEDLPTPEKSIQQLKKELVTIE
jgi:DNA-damage-inducible protein D